MCEINLNFQDYMRLFLSKKNWRLFVSAWRPSTTSTTKTSWPDSAKTSTSLRTELSSSGTFQVHLVLLNPKRKMFMNRKCSVLWTEIILTQIYVSELERDSVLMMLRKSVKVEKEPYEEEDIFEESEMMNVGIVETASNGGDSKKSTHLDSKGNVPVNRVQYWHVQ